MQPLEADCRSRQVSGSFAGAIFKRLYGWLNLKHDSLGIWLRAKDKCRRMRMQKKPTQVCCFLLKHEMEETDP